jgi:hypothetical protein
MGAGIPEIVQRELLDVVGKAVGEHGSGRPSDASGSEDDRLIVEDAIVRALMMWASRGNPVSRATDLMVERAVRTAMARGRS